MTHWAALLCLPGIFVAAGCGGTSRMQEQPADSHSYSNPHQARVKHLELDLEAVFEEKKLRGWALLELVRADGNAPVVLDTRDLAVDRVEAAPAAEGTWQAARFELGKKDPVLGSPLTVQLPAGAAFVRIHYATAPEASGLQWLDPAQTAGKKRPFLYTQSQAIHARSWIPIQDSPGVRMTYRARIRTPRDLIALMGARQDFRLANPKEAPSGDYTFRMPQAIPAYLIALAVGDLEFRYLGYRTGVWCEPPVADLAQAEFADTERMMQAAEKLFGPYDWLRYDILVLPPGFPFGGMENPMMTFATPTILAGDKSLVSMIAHELAHSWSGNLVTNATWRDFWLNEGFTVYVERRILEAVYGVERARMEAQLGRGELEEEMKGLAPADQVLHIDLAGRDPDDAVTSVPYEKGALFLTAIEEAFGRDAFDAFLAGYVRRFRFQSITTGEFRRYLEQNLLARRPEAASKAPVEEWLTKPGLPVSAPRITSEAFAKVDEAARDWRSGAAVSTEARTKGWNTHQWLHFLRALGEKPTAEQMARLDREFGFGKRGNSEILHQWLLMAIRADYRAAMPRVEAFLTSIGRRKFLKPLYEEMVKTPEGRRRAEAIFAKARAGYHPIARSTVEEILKKASAN